MPGVLSGLRVLDFGRYIAGPFCGMLLADLGADVIRVEKRQGSEDRYITPVTDTGDGALFLELNRNKRSLTLDPTPPEGRSVVKRLVATADVVIANLPAPSLTAMGLDYDTLKAIRPDIILATITAFGDGGPDGHRVGFDAVAQALSGAVYIGGRPGDPIKSYVPWADFGSAALVAFGIMAALLERQRSGKGQKVEGALLHTAVTFNNALLIEQALLKPNREPTANRSPFSGPSDLFTTKDGAVIVQVVGQPLFERWVKLIGEPNWLSDPRFKDDISRGTNGSHLSARMAAWCADKTTAEVLRALDAARIPCGPVYRPADTLNDPQVQAMGFLKAVACAGLSEPAPLATTPVRLSETPGEIRHRAPMLGEHTDEILQSLGLSADEIERLRSIDVV